MDSRILYWPSISVEWFRVRVCNEIGVSMIARELVEDKGDAIGLKANTRSFDNCAFPFILKITDLAFNCIWFHPKRSVSHQICIMLQDAGGPFKAQVLSILLADPSFAQHCKAVVNEIRNLGISAYAF